MPKPQKVGVVFSLSVKERAYNDHITYLIPPSLGYNAKAWPKKGCSQDVCVVTVSLQPKSIYGECLYTCVLCSFYNGELEDTPAVAVAVFSMCWGRKKFL